MEAYISDFHRHFNLAELIKQSTYVKVHGSVSLDALQRKEAKESAYSKVQHPAFKITTMYFQENLLCYLLVKNRNYRSFRLDFGNVSAQFRRNIPGE